MLPFKVAAHDWIRSDCNSAKCQVCHKKIKTLAGRCCMWCQEMVSACVFCFVGCHRSNKRVSARTLSPVVSLFFQRHDECLYSGISSCNCGQFRDHILPPWAIYAVSKVKNRNTSIKDTPIPIPVLGVYMCRYHNTDTGRICMFMIVLQNL